MRTQSFLRAAKALIRHIRGKTTDSHMNEESAWGANIEFATNSNGDSSMSVEPGGRDVDKELWEAQMEKQHQEELTREQENAFQKQI